LNSISSPARPQASLGSPLSVHENPQSHRTTASHALEQETSLYNMPEMLTTGLHPGKVPVARGIDRSDPSHLTKLSKDAAHKLSKQNLHGRFRIHNHDLAKGSIVGVSQSRTGQQSCGGSPWHDSKRSPTFNAPGRLLIVQDLHTISPLRFSSCMPYIVIAREHGQKQKIRACPSIAYRIRPWSASPKSSRGTSEYKLPKKSLTEEKACQDPDQERTFRR
jgi:hypothetical protein